MWFGDFCLETCGELLSALPFHHLYHHCCFDHYWWYMYKHSSYYWYCYYHHYLVASPAQLCEQSKQPFDTIWLRSYRIHQLMKQGWTSASLKHIPNSPSGWLWAANVAPLGPHSLRFTRFASQAVGRRFNSGFFGTLVFELTSD